MPNSFAIGGDNLASRARARQRGAGHVKAIVWLLIMIVFAYVSFEVIPVLFAEYQFQDDVQTAARYAPFNRQTPDDVRESVLKSAQSHDLPVTAADIAVVPHGYGVQIDVNYSVTVNLQVYQWTFDFHPSATSLSLT